MTLPVPFAFLILAQIPVGCSAPSESIQKLRDYLSYYNEASATQASVQVFTFAEVGHDSLFLQRGTSEQTAMGPRTVYAFRSGLRLMEGSCPADSRWVECADLLLPQDPEASPSRAASQTCDLSITVPAWHPSPDTRVKRSLAADLLHELVSFGYSDSKEVYVRDFNVDDPDITFYVVDRDGQEHLQGCTFDRSRRPHCGWHLFGQAPIESLKEDVMARPYRLFPPATSKPPSRPVR